MIPDPVLLHRYSDLTYNGHRNHYDPRYAVDVEFYPARVVHGPLLANLMVELVEQSPPDARLANFQFKSIRPTFDTKLFSVCAKREGRRIRLCTADDGGFLCFTAEATLA